MTLQPVQPEADFSTEIDTLGPCRVASPTKYSLFVSDQRRILYDLDAARVAERLQSDCQPVTFEEAGPREQLYFEPDCVKAAVVTCGGLCPGLNDVIRSIVHELYYVYGVRDIKGVRYGYAGLNPIAGWPMIDLTPAVVRNIHEDGGTFLGSSRGPQPSFTGSVMSTRLSQSTEPP